MGHAVRTPVAAPAPAPAAPSVRRWPTLDHVWAFLPVAIPILVSLASRMVAVDLAYHVRVGDSILGGGGIPRVDTFSFTSEGAAWLDQQWAAQVVLALAHRGGFAAVAVLRALMIGGSFGLIFLACRAKGASPRSASLLSLGGFVVCLQALAMRPQLFAFLLFSASIWVLASRDPHPRRCWLLLPIAIAWANLHGSFFLLPLLCGLAAIEDVLHGRAAWRRMAWFALACAAATLVNPFGFRVWMYVVELSTNPVIRETITEWAPMSVSTFAGVAFFASALLIAGWLARRPSAADRAGLLWLATFFVLALPARRGVLWWAIVAPVVVAGLLADRPAADGTAAARQADQGSRTLNVVVLSVLTGLIIVLLPWVRGTSTEALLLEAPSGLSSATRDRLPAGANVFVPQAWGSWFEFATPDQQVFIDARIELFPRPTWDDYDLVREAGPGWESVLDRWSVDAIVVDTRPAWDEIDASLRSSPGWCVATEDTAGTLFLRGSTVDGRCPAP